jgi:peroxiredoxin
MNQKAKMTRALKIQSERISAGIISAMMAGIMSVIVCATVATPGRAQTKPAHATEKVELAAIDKPFKDFTLRDLTAEKGSLSEKVSLASFRGQKAVVLIFMANRCGATWTYEPKIGKMLADYKDKPVAFMTVHSPYEESDKEIIGQFEQRNLTMPILDDKPTQSLASYASATVTPLFYIIDREGVLRYKGAFDKFSDENIMYVRPALDAILAGKLVTVKTSRALGCALTIRPKNTTK